MLSLIGKLALLGQAALYSRPIRIAYIASQQRALDAVRDLPRDHRRSHQFARLWLRYFAEEYVAQDVQHPEE